MSSVAPSPTTADRLTPEERYFNRELSWLAFNERVLAEACQPRLPAARAAALPVDLGQQPRRVHDDPRRRPRRAGAQRRRQRLDRRQDARRSSSPRSTPRCAELEDAQQRILSDLRRLLAAEGIHFATYERIDAARRTLAQGLLPRPRPAGDHPAGDRPRAPVPVRLQHGHRRAVQPHPPQRREPAARDGADPERDPALRARPRRGGDRSSPSSSSSAASPDCCFPASASTATACSACCATATSRSRKKPRTWSATSAPRSSGAGAGG